MNNTIHNNPEPHQPRDIKQSESVLLVDDNLSVRKVTALALTCLGYSVFSVDNAEAALRFAKVHSDLKLLITDVKMPGMSGYELADKLRQQNPQLGVLFCSGYPQSSQEKEVAGHEGCGFLAKPIRVASLSEKIKGILGWSVSHSTDKLCVA